MSSTRLWHDQRPTCWGAVDILVGMTEETRIALRNYDFLVRSKGLDDVEIDWDSDTIVVGDGGVLIDVLLEPGFTPATS